MIFEPTETPTFEPTETPTFEPTETPTFEPSLNIVQKSYDGGASTSASESGSIVYITTGVVILGVSLVSIGIVLLKVIV